MYKIIIKSFLLENWKNIAIIILAILLFKSCQGEKELILANKDLKTEVKELVISAKSQIEKNKSLNDKISVLEKQKLKVKTEIVYIQNKTKSEVKKVESLSTKQIANYYQERYKLPVTITQYGVSLNDTIAKKNIVDLIERDGCFEELKLVKIDLKIEESKGVLKDTIIDNLTKSNSNFEKAITSQSGIITNIEKSSKKEKAKKTFWQIITTGAILTAGYSLMR